jgi:hypothetical protein
MKRHIAATPKCKHKWEKEMGAPSNTKAAWKSTTTHLETDKSTFDNLDTWDDSHAFVPEPSPEPRPSKRARVEEVEDEDSVRVQRGPDTQNRRFVEAYPRPAGIAIGQGKTKFQILHEKQTKQGESNYAPFANKEEWELAQWLSRRVGQTAIDEYLKLPIVSPEFE